MIINVLRHLQLYYGTTPPAPAPYFFYAIRTVSVKGCGKIIEVIFLSEGSNLVLPRALRFFIDFAPYHMF